MNKKCPQCGKELPAESNFCPYCMTKLAHEEEMVGKFPPKPKRKKWLVYIGVAVILVIVAIVLIVFRKPAEQKVLAPTIVSSSSSEVSKPTSTASSSESKVSKASSAVVTINYTSYVGKWYDEPSQNKTDIETLGGDCLQIVSVNGNQMVFSLMSVTEPPQNRIAKIDNVVGLIDGESVSFAFTDDGWGNAGKGILKLKDGEIYAQVTITTPNSTAQTSLAMQSYFKKVKESTSSAPIDLSQILTNYPDIRGRLGEETAKSYLNQDTGFEVHTYGVITVSVDLTDDTVMDFLIDYTKLSDKKAYCFDTVDENSTYKNIIAKYGNSKSEYPVDGGKEVGYNYKKGYYVKFTFNTSGKLSRIYCFSTNNGI